MELFFQNADTPARGCNKNTRIQIRVEKCNSHGRIAASTFFRPIHYNYYYHEKRSIILLVLVRVRPVRKQQIDCSHVI